jgi:hypothetical protein
VDAKHFGMTVKKVLKQIIAYRVIDIFPGIEFEPKT